MTLLGINCGFGNKDCSVLPVAAVDLADHLLNFPRPKTGVAREAVLWPETVAAIREVLRERPEPHADEFRHLLFLSFRGYPFEHNRNGNIAQEFRKLLKKHGIHRKGVGFYALRHMFATIGRRARDQEAVDYVMGHVPTDSVKAGYCEFVERERLEVVAAEVRDWLFHDQAK